LVRLQHWYQINIIKTLKIKKADLIREHKRLIPLLKKAGLLKEVKIQEEELEELEENEVEVEE
jgi:hypothetical protein